MQIWKKILNEPVREIREMFGIVEPLNFADRAIHET